MHTIFLSLKKIGRLRDREESVLCEDKNGIGKPENTRAGAVTRAALTFEPPINGEGVGTPQLPEMGEARDLFKLGGG